MLDTRASAHAISDQAELLIARRWVHLRIIDAGAMLITSSADERCVRARQQFAPPCLRRFASCAVRIGRKRRDFKVLPTRLLRHRICGRLVAKQQRGKIKAIAEYTDQLTVKEAIDDAEFEQLQNTMAPVIEAIRS